MAAAAQYRNLIVLDSTVHQPKALLAGLPEGSVVLRLVAGSDPLAQIAAAVAGLVKEGTPAAALHLVSHGGDGFVVLDGQRYDATAVEEHGEALAAIGADMAPGADWLLYGCNVAAGGDGRAFIAAWAAAVGGDVAASTDLTGAAALGGNWVLEAAVGAVDTGLPFGQASLTDYEGLLLAPAASGTLTFTGLSAGYVSGDASSATRTSSEMPELSGFTFSAHDADGASDGEAAIRVQWTPDSVAVNDASGNFSSGRIFGNSPSSNELDYVQLAADDGYVVDFGSIDVAVSAATAGAPLLVTTTVTGYDQQGHVVASAQMPMTVGSGVGTFTSHRFDLHDFDFTGIATLRVAVSEDVQFIQIDNVSWTNARIPVHETVPTIIATATHPTFVENFFPVDLFNGVIASTNDSGQTFSGLTLTVSNVVNNLTEILSFNGTGVVLSNGNAGNLGGIGSYSVTVAGGMTTVSIDGMVLSGAQMATLIDGMTYSNTSQDPGGASRTITIAEVRDNGGSNHTAAPSISSTVNVIPVNDKPVATVFPAAPVFFTEGGVPVSLFAVVDINPSESSQTIANLTFEMFNVTDGADELLHIDGTEIALTAGNAGTTAGMAVSYAVGVVGDTTTITLTMPPGGLSASLVNSMVAGMGYSNTSQAPSNGSRSIELVSVTDNGGTANGGVDTGAASGISTTISVQGVNTAPIITGFDANDNQTVLSGDEGVPIDIGTAISVQDDGNLSGGRITITLGGGMEGDSLTLVEGNGIGIVPCNGSSSWIDVDGVSGVAASSTRGDHDSPLEIRLWGSISAEMVQKLLQNVRFSTDSDAAGPRLISVTVRDSEGLTSLPASAVIDVEVSPSITGVGVPTPALYAADDALEFTVVFSASVDVTGSPALSLIIGEQTVQALYQSGTGTDTLSFAYTVQSGDADLDGIQVGALQLNGGAIQAGGAAASLFLQNVGSTLGVLVDAVPPPSSPTLSAIGIDPDFIENADAVGLFTGVAAATNDGGQTFTGVTLTVNHVADGGVAGEQEFLAIAGTEVALSNGNAGSIPGVGTYSVTFNAGLTVIELDGMVLDDAQMTSLIESIGYRNASEDPSGASRVVTLTQIVDSGEANNIALSNLVSTVGITPVNDAPSAIILPFPLAMFTEGGAATSLFLAANINPIEAGQSIIGMTFTISNLSDGASELLHVDGTAIALTDGNSGATAGLAVSYLVDVIGGNATITLSMPSGLDSASAQSLVAGMAYSNTSDAPGQQVRTIALTSVTDSGGTANGGVDTGATSNIPTSIFVQGVNTAPIITGFDANDNQTVLSGSEGVPIDIGTAISVQDDGDLAWSTLTIAIIGGSAGDTLALVEGNGIGIVPCNGSSSWITIDGHAHVAASSTQGTHETALEIRLWNGISADMVQKLLQNVQFSTDSDVAGPRTISVTVKDSDNATSLPASAVITVAVEPTVTGVDVPADGVYAEGHELTFTVQFSAEVDVTGMPALTLLIGDTPVQAIYDAGSGTNILTFSYTVQSGDLDLDGILVGGLSLNEGAIQADGVAANLYLNAVGSTANIRVDGVPPAQPAAPLLTFASDTGVPGDGITAQATPMLTGMAEAGSTVTLYDSNGTTVLGTAVADLSGGWWITSSPLTDGAHTLTVKATDAAGNTSTASIPLTLTIDTAAPAEPVVTSTALTRMATPIIDGTAEAGATVTVTVAGATYTTVAADGLWSIDLASATPVSGTLALNVNGSNTIVVTATDAAGNTSVAGSQSLVIDTTAPMAPDAPLLDAASDTGAAVDGLTSATMPTITGTAESSSIVALYDTDGTTVLGTAVADALTGAWSITSLPLADGEHTLTVTATDAAGNTSVVSAPLLLTIDTAEPLAPSAPVLDALSDSGTSGDNLTNATTPIITGTAETGSTVTLYGTDGATVLGTAVADALTGIWSITTSALSDGPHTLTATATDAAGNTSVASAVLALTIDTAAPPVPVAPVLDAASDTGAIGDDLTSNATPTLTGTAEAGSTVTLYGTDGATVLGTAVADALTGIWSITSSALVDGMHTLTAIATDAAGNASATSLPLTLTIDAAAPAAPVITSTALTNMAAPILEGAAETGAIVSVDIGGATYTTVAADGIWSIDLATATPVSGTLALNGNGSNTIAVTATDAAGNISATGNQTLVIDTTAPASPDAPVMDAASDTGIAGDNVTSNATPTVSGTAEADSAITLYGTDGVTLLGTAVADALTGAWSITSLALTDGEHTLTAIATDAAGNASAVSIPLTLTIDTAAPVAPAITSNALTNLAAPTLEGTAEAGAVITVAVAGAMYTTVAVDGGWSIDLATAAATSGTLALNTNGNNTISVTATDAAGNVSALGSQTLVIDTAAPIAPLVPLLDVASDTGAVGDNITSNVTPTLIGLAEAGSIITLYDTDGTTVLGATAADASTGAWSITSLALIDGEHMLTVTATDAAGNTSASSAPLLLTIDLATPAAPGALMLDAASDSGELGDGLTRMATPTVTGMAEAGATVTLYATNGTTVLGTAIADALTGAWSITSGFLGDGVHRLTATATDAAGNTSPASAALTLTIDTMEPATPGALLLDPASDTGVAGDNLTKISTPTVGGTAEAGSTVTLYDSGAIVLGTAVADASGAWGIASSVLGDGAHTLTATATDAAGNVSAVSAPLVLTIDASAPAAPTLVFGAQANAWSVAVGGLEAGATWEYRVSANGDWSAGAGNRFDIALATYNAGQVQVRQTDKAGNTSEIGANAAPLTPPPPPVAPDDDGDGLPDDVEALVPGLDGGTPGDGNGDGLPDIEQSDVTSLPWVQTPDGQTRYVTLTNDAGLTQAMVSTVELDVASVPGALTLPLGALAFTVRDVPASGVVHFSLIIDSDIPVNGYWKPIDGQWVNIATAIAEVGGKTRIDFAIEDGGVFDADGERNGVIVDPGAPGWFDGNPLDVDGDQFPDLLEFAAGLAPGVKDNDVYARDDLFVMQLYRDALGREAESEGLAYWEGRLEQGATRAQTVLEVLNSLEAQDGVIAFSRLGVSLAEKGAEALDLTQWRTELAEGATVAALTEAAVTGHYGGVSDTEFLDLLYHDVLGRAADAEGRAYWLGALADGTQRGDVALHLMYSTEFEATHGAEVEVALLYAGLLGRAVDEEGLAYWSAGLEDGGSSSALIDTFLASAEYHDRFLPPVDDMFS